VRVRAFAKINRSLRVVATRADGYHELRTIFQSIALHDTLTVRAIRGPFRLTCDDPACPVDDRNLIAGAAARMWRAAGRRGAPRDVAVHLRKRIPMQAGLGGGSSDGAAAIRALASIWRVRLSRARRQRLAAAMGADVPYFLEGGTALGRDRGDRLSRLVDRPRAWVVLTVPRFGVSTREAFSWWDQQVGQVGRVGRVGQGRRVGRARHDFSNDLQPVVARRHPIVATLVADLERSGAFQASLSGSGSAVFGLFARRSQAEGAARALRRRAPRRLVLVTRTLTRRECAALAAK